MILRVPINHDKLYQDTIDKGVEVTFLDEYDYFNQIDVLRLETKLNDKVDGDNVNIIPSCLCKEMAKEYEVGNYCPNCDTVIKNRLIDFYPDLWIEIPEQFEHWINPAFVKRFTLALPVAARHLFRWMGDRENNPMIKKVPIAETPIFQAVRAIDGFERSYNFFRDNIPEIIKAVISVSKDTESNKRLINMLDYYDRFKDRIFSKKIPVLSRRFMITEKGIRTNHVFKESVRMSDMVLTLQSALATGKKMEIRVTNFIVNMVTMLDSVEANIIGGKHGIFKENIEGMRTPFSMRAVITSIVGKHEYNEVRLPWGPTVYTLKPFIVNKLRRRGYKYNDIISKINTAIFNYDEEINEIFKELIKERGGKISVAVMRNPAMSNFGTQYLNLYKVKTDVEDTTISLSTKTVGYGNGDIDGDQENVFVPIDIFMSEAMEAFRSENCVAGRLPGELFEKVTITKPIVAILSNRIRDERTALKI